MFTSKHNMSIQNKIFTYQKLQRIFKMLIFSAGKDGLNQTFSNMNCNLTVSSKSLKNVQVI